jgi:ATP-dependent RNA helicase RhlE
VTFESFDFHPHIVAGVKAVGYTTPTPIQTQTIPPILQNKDVMGLAQTGTGKTAAFALPILQRLMNGPRRKLRALVIAPTRELAEQICESFTELGQKTGLRAMTVYGGVGMGPQLRGLRDGAEIVVACPGRLLDHIQRGSINLTGVEVLVLDEADRMFDMGFLPSIRQVIKSLPARRQTLLFSATMPDDIRRLAKEILHDPVTVEIGLTAPLEAVSHALYPVEQGLKTGLLMELLRNTDTESVLVFTRTKHRAKRVAQQLSAAGHGATCLQGNLSQNARQTALNGFRDGTFQILVATDIAARGIDVSTISHVVNYDMPNTADDYTHRIGRTGRAAKTGDAYTMVSPDDEAMVRSIERVMGCRLERRHVKGFEYTASAPKGEFNRAPRPPRPTSQRSKPAAAGVSPWSQSRRTRSGR